MSLTSKAAPETSRRPTERGRCQDAYDAEDGLVEISLNPTRQKTRNPMARPRAALLIPDPASPYRTLELRGDVEITADDDHSFARHVGRK